MERIKQALERARAERREQADSRPPESEQHPAPAQAASIDYQQTRVIPVSSDVLSERRVIAGLDEIEADDAYRVLRTQVLQRMQSHQWNTLAVTSAGAGEGKTLTAVNLAISLAREFTNTVLLVDLDLRRPSVHRYFGYEPTHGLTDYLLAGSPLTEILFNPGIERLVILPAGTPRHDSSELLRSPKMVKFVQELKSGYPGRLILFDLPPLLLGDDALTFTPYVDCALLVIEDGKTHPEHVTRAAELLQHTNFLGTVLNKATHAQSSYYY